MEKINVKGRKATIIAVVVLVLAMLVLGMGLAGQTAYATENKTVTTKVAHISDSHVMPLSYCNEYSEKFISKGIGSAKLMLQSEATLETALNGMYKATDAPSILLLSGDITSNGEYEANKRVAQILGEFTAKMRTREGYEKFQIFIIPGNHDMYNESAVSYMPTDKELAKCNTDEERLALMKNYAARSVRTTTSKDIFTLYSDFGYCDCPGRKEGHHTGDCKIAEGTVINFFYESDFWYEGEPTPTRTSDAFTNFDVRRPTDDETNGFKDNGKDFEYLAPAGRIGICSYIATLDGVTVVGVDANARKYVGVPDKTAAKYTAIKSGNGWAETTGGMVPRQVLRWIAEETKDEVRNGNLMLLNCHFNNVPHFEAQDEVISLFVLDNYELYNSTLAKAGIRYSFSGHQHSIDVVDTVTQDGHVVYDFETGSLISYGAGYRTVDFTQKWENGEYSEEVKTDIHSLKANNDAGTFDYATYKLTSELGGTPALAEDVVDPEMFSLLPVNLYEATDYLTLAKDTLKDDNGTPTNMADYLVGVQYRMITMNGIVGNFVNEDLIPGLAASMEKSLTSSLGNFTGKLVGALLQGVSTLDFPAIEISADGKTFTVTENAVAGNGIIDSVSTLAEYFLNYDFSYGTREGGTRLAEIFLDVYGGHLAGVTRSGISELVQPLINALNDGTFVHFLVDTLVNAIIPELDYLFNVPIRFNSETAVLPAGKGIDITAIYENEKSGGGMLGGIVDSAIKNILQSELFKTTDENGYYSVKLLLKDLLAIVDDILVTPEEQIESNTIKALLDTFGVRELIKDLGVEKYINMGKKYVGAYLTDGKIYNVLKEELLDKYVTDAFCRNLGNYAAYLIGSVSADDTPDGGSWGEGDRTQVYTVTYQKGFTVATTKYDAAQKFGGKAYVRKADGSDTLTVPATAETGLTASMISVSFNGDVGTTKKVRWFTSIDSDIMEKKADGSYYEYGEKVPQSYIKYALNKEDVDKATPVLATSFNRDVELPTIDLGIMYFNMSHRWKLYNVHEVKLEGLKDGKTYYYKLGSDEYGWTETYSFTTAEKGSFRFLAITDIQGSVEKNYTESMPNLEIAMKQYDDPDDIAFIASMGDNVDNGKSILQYTWWLDDQRSVWANNTLVTLAGNHEKKGYSLSNVVAVPDDATVQETGYYYSYDYNHAHFIVLDTNDLSDAKELSAKQIEWLKADLEKNKKADWTIVMLHKGPYTAGSHAFDEDVIALRKQLTPLFAGNGVDLVLQGHDHTYSVSEYIGADGKPTSEGKGVLYINLGTMGDKFYNYIYSNEVTLKKYAKVDEKLQKYLTKDGNLELTETPVFADIEVQKGKITIKTYTIVDGEAVEIEKIVLKNGLGGGAIAGIVVGSGVGAAGIGVGLFFLIRKLLALKAAKVA